MADAPELLAIATVAHCRAAHNPAGATFSRTIPMNINLVVQPEARHDWLFDAQ
jgi:hypothetical protein